MKYLSVSVLFALVLGLLAGCGGGGNGAGAGNANTGRASFTVTWPERSRLIPLRAESIKIDATQGGQPVATSQVVARPASGNETSPVMFPALPIGDVDITATAYPNADATGTPQAVGKVTIRINSGQTTQATLTMGSTVVRLEVTPSSALLNRGGGSVQLNATARDAAGAVVLLPTDDSPQTIPSTLTYESSDPLRATVDGGGRVTASSESSDVTVTVTETESGITGQATIFIRGPVTSFQFVQTNPQVAVGDQVALSVVARDDTGTEVPLPANRISYTTSDAQIATVTPGGQGATDPGGRVTGVAAGTATITATDPVSALTATTTVTVTAAGPGAGTLVVSPEEVTLAPDAQQQFTATIDGADVAVTWSVSGAGTASGTIDANGLYTAPSADPGGPITVTAETADNKTATATVTIQEDE